jgi:hypothetical protein
LPNNINVEGNHPVGTPLVSGPMSAYDILDFTPVAIGTLEKHVVIQSARAALTIRKRLSVKYEIGSSSTPHIRNEIGKKLRGESERELADCTAIHQLDQPDALPVDSP